MIHEQNRTRARDGIPNSIVLPISGQWTVGVLVVRLAEPMGGTERCVVAVENLEGPCLRHCSAARNSSRAFCQSRRTVRSVKSSTSAISPSLKPPK